MGKMAQVVCECYLKTHDKKNFKKILKLMFGDIMLSCIMIIINIDDMEDSFLERLSRLLRIINLIQSNPGIKARELAERCETSERTIYRDLEVLHAANIPVVNEGKGKGYTFLGNFKLYPINWAEDEYNAFKMLPLLLQKKFQSDAFHRAYEKVMAAHSAEKIEREDLISNISKVIQSGRSPGAAKEKKLLPIISEAILSNRTIDTIYHTQSRNKTTKRKIDPYYLVPRNSRLYIIGYCHLKKDFRTFRLSRFQHVKILDQTFTRDQLSLEKYLEHTWSVIRGDKQIHFKVKFSQNVARYIKEEDFNVMPKLTDLPDGGLLFEVTVNDEREFLRWLRQYGPDAEILEPIQYRDQMKKILAEWLNVYER